MTNAAKIAGLVLHRLDRSGLIDGGTLAQGGRKRGSLEKARDRKLFAFAFGINDDTGACVSFIQSTRYANRSSGRLATGIKRGTFKVRQVAGTKAGKASSARSKCEHLTSQLARNVDRDRAQMRDAARMLAAYDNAARSNKKWQSQRIFTKFGMWPKNLRKLL